MEPTALSDDPMGGPKGDNPFIDEPADLGTPPDQSDPPLPPGGAWDDCNGTEFDADRCALIPMPVFHERDGESLDVLVTRTAARTQPAQGQLWMLQGGPGGSGNVFNTRLWAARLDFDVFVVQHRGVAPSEELRCPQTDIDSELGNFLSESEIDPCVAFVKAEYGDALAGFSTTQAAHDVATAIEAMAGPDQEVFLYGASYGTFWANRVLELDRVPLSGVILDSLVAPGLTLDGRGDALDQVVARMAKACTDDDECSERLGPDPLQRVLEVHAELAAGLCPDAGLTSDDLVNLIGRLIVGQAPGLVFPLVHRIGRCDPGDVALVHELTAPASSFFSDVNRLVWANVGLSELWGDLDDRCEGATLCVPDLGLATLPERWPRYTEPLGQTWPETDVPIFAIAGDYDIQTPVEQARTIESAPSLQRVHYLEVEAGNHALLSFDACVGDRLESFVLDPRGFESKPCTESAADPLGIDDGDLSRFFGGRDAWDNGAEAPAEPRLVGRGQWHDGPLPLSLR